MLQSIEIRDLRGIDEGTLRPLRPLTILVGRNNAGKTTCLEAISIGGWPTASVVAELLSAAHSRGALRIATLLPEGRITLRVQDGADTRVVTVAVESTDPWTIGVYVGEDRDLMTLDEHGEMETIAGSLMAEYGRPPTVLRPSDGLDGHDLDFAMSMLSQGGTGALERTVEILRKSTPGLKDIRAVHDGVSWVPAMMFGDRTVPLSCAGDGTKRLFYIASHAGLKSTLMLEEPEVSFHAASLIDLAHLMWASVSAGRQVIATTHSLDLLRRLTDVADATGRLNEMSILWLERNDRVLTVREMTGYHAALLGLMGRAEAEGED